MAAIPLQGIAASTMLFCAMESHHPHGAQAKAAPHGQGHAATAGHDHAKHGHQKASDASASSSSMSDANHACGVWKSHVGRRRSRLSKPVRRSHSCSLIRLHRRSRTSHRAPERASRRSFWPLARLRSPIRCTAEAVAARPFIAWGFHAFQSVGLCAAHHRRGGCCRRWRCPSANLRTAASVPRRSMSAGPMSAYASPG